MSIEFWKETFLPLFEILISAIFGFLFLLSFELASVLPIQSNLLILPYPELLLVAISSSLIALIFKGLFRIGKSKPVYFIILFIYTLINSYLIYILNRPLIHESILNKWEVFVIFSVIFLTTSFHSFYFRDAKSGGFLAGIFLYSIIQSYISIDPESYKVILLIFLIVGTISISLILLFDVPNQFLPTKSIQKEYKFYGSIYSSFAILTIIHVAITALRGFESFYVTIFLFLFAFMGARIFAIYFHNESNFRKSIIFGRNLIAFSFILMAASFSFDGIGLILFIILGGALGFYHSEKSIIKNYSLILLLSIASIGIILAIIQLAKLQYQWIHVLVFLSILVFYPFLKSARMEPTSKHSPVLIAIFFSVFLFKTPIFQPILLKSENITIANDPIPYLLSNLLDNNKNYIFIQSGLPYDSKNSYPNLEELRDSIPIIGYSENNKLINYYREFCNQNSIPYYTIQVGGNLNVSLSSTMLYKIFPGFIIYYSVKDLEPGWNRELTLDWKFNYILEKLREEPEFNSHHKVLSKMEAYSSYEIKKEISIYKNLVQSSIRNYCEYFMNQSLYSDSLNCYLKELDFGDISEISIKNTYHLLSFTTPGIVHIPLLERLAKEPQYNISINKKIYPIYLSMNMHSEAVKVLENLIKELSNGKENQEESKSLELELARSLLESEKLEKAYPIIQSSLRKDPESLLWNRLLKVYEEKLEARKRNWSPPPRIDTKGID